MTIYLLNFITIPIYNKLIKNKKVLVSILTLQMFLILALRSETLGVDVENYREYYRLYQQNSFYDIISSFRIFGRARVTGGHESGYVLLNWIIGKMGFSFHSFLVIHSAICITSVSVFIYKYSKDPAMSFAMFIGFHGFSYMFGILRQTLALAVLLFSVNALKERNFLKYLFLVIIAGLFHTAAWLALPIYFLANRRVTRAYCIFSIGLGIIFTFLAPIVLNGMLDSIFDFLKKEYVLQQFQWNNMFLLMIIFALFFAIFYHLIEDDSIFATIFLYAILIQSVAFYLSNFSRAAIGLFLPALFILYPNSILRLKHSQEKFFIRSFSYIVLFFFYFYCLQSDANVPYLSIFEI